MAADRSYIAVNDRERHRLDALVDMLDDVALSRALPGGWTVAGVLAHLARYLMAEPGARVEHREKDSLDFERGVETAPDPRDRRAELRRHISRELLQDGPPRNNLAGQPGAPPHRPRVRRPFSRGDCRPRSPAGTR